MNTNPSALVIIDMINEFVHPEGKLPVQGASEIVPRLVQVLTAWRQGGQPVIHVVRQHRPDGSDVESVRREAFRRLNGFCLPGSWGGKIVAGLGPRPGEPIIVKHAWSAFFDTDLDQQLRQLGVSTLVIGGTQTPNCVRATIYDATARGYDIILLDDGTSAATAEIQAANLRDLAAMGIAMTSCSAIIQEVRAKGLNGPQLRAYLRVLLPAERAKYSRLIAETIREGDARLNTVLRIPILAWFTRRALHNLYHHRSNTLILEVDRTAAGFIVLRPVGDALRVEALGVFTSFRRQGWGYWLLGRAQEEARKLGLARLELQVSPANEPALELYWRAGFRPLPRRRGALWMEQAVPSPEEIA